MSARQPMSSRPTRPSIRVNDERERGLLHPLLIIAIFVVVFLEIHPFQDGNGRLSRVLTTLLLIQLTGASRNTLKQHFRHLTERNHLEQHGSGSGVWHGLGNL